MEFRVPVFCAVASGFSSVYTLQSQGGQGNWDPHLTNQKCVSLLCDVSHL